MSIRIAALFLLLLSNSIFSFAQQGEWTWMHGCNVTGCGPVWGTQGIPDPDNTPGGVYAPYFWIDQDGFLWTYGGIGTGLYNAMWKFDPYNVEWTWMSGVNYAQSVTAGPIGVFDESYTPGYRQFGSVCWTDNDGKFWLFGGDMSGGTGSDLWQYDPSINQWALMSGSTLGYVNPYHGQKGIPSANNTPGSRREGNATWVDAEGNLWMYGGERSGQFHNDMWKYDVALNQWVWMAGTALMNQAAVYGTQGVADSLNNPSGRSSYCKWTSNDGKFWLFGGGNWGTEKYYADLWMYDPATNYWTWMSGPTSNNVNATAGDLCDSSVTYHPASRFEDRACAKDECGNFWMWGGIHKTSTDKNVNDLWVYRPEMNDWTYVSGSLTFNNNGQYGTQGQSDPDNVPGSRMGSIMWFDTLGHIWMFCGSPNWSLSYFNDVWRYIPDETCPASGTCVPPTSANFIASDTALCEKFCIDFTDLSINNPVAWEWNFEGASPNSSTDQNPVGICYDDPGIYDVTLITTGAGGLVDTLLLADYISVYQNPFAPTITQAGNMLTASAAVSYQWYFNGNEIPGATDQSYTMAESGFYTVEITNENGCKAQSSIKAYLTGIEENHSPISITVFANPASSDVIISGSIRGTGELIVVLYNEIGQQLLTTEQKVSSTFQFLLDVSPFPPGLYAIEVIGGDARSYHPVLISR
jgi:PKD repeat protein